MAAGQPPHSFTTSTQDKAVFHRGPSSHNTAASSLRLDRFDQGQRLDHHANQTHLLLQCLVQNPLRITYLSTMIAFLCLDDTSWNCMQHLRKHQETAVILQPVLPQLYQIPKDIACQLEGIRSDPEWSSIKDLVIKNLVAGTVPPITRPLPIRSSSFSPRSSTLSTVSTISSTDENSNRSSMTSFTSMNSLQRSVGPGTPQDQADHEATYTPASMSSPIVSTPPVVPPKDDKEQDGHPCESQHCPKSFSRFGDLKNHVFKCHPESQQAMMIQAIIKASRAKKKPAHSPTAVGRPLFGEIVSTPPNPLLDYGQPHDYFPDQLVSVADFGGVFDNHDFDIYNMNDLSVSVGSHFENTHVQVYAYGDCPLGVQQAQFPHQAQHDTVMGGTTTNVPPPVPQPIFRSSSNAKLGRKEVRDSLTMGGQTT